MDTDTDACSESSEPKAGIRWQWLAVIIALILVAFVIWGAAVTNLWWPIPDKDHTKAGTFGDAFGPLTSFFTACTLGGTVIAVVMQSNELRLQRIELRDHRREMASQTKSQNRMMIAQEAANKLTFLDLVNRYWSILAGYRTARERLRGKEKGIRLEAMSLDQQRQTCFELCRSLREMAKDHGWEGQNIPDPDSDLSMDGESR